MGGRIDRCGAAVTIALSARLGAPMFGAQAVLRVLDGEKNALWFRAYGSLACYV
jgi:hypothetical protein